MASAKRITAIMKKYREEKKLVSKEERPWANLHEALMESIMKKLYFCDHIRLRAVCKGWRSMYRVAPKQQPPWMMIFNNKEDNSEEENRFCYTLHDPVYNKFYSIAHNLEFLKAKNLNILACKRGWLLVSEYKHGRYSLVLHNPFIKSPDNIIELPELNHARLNIDVAAFSTTPTSSDCVFFTLQETSLDNVCISTCRLEDEEWITQNFQIPYTFYPYYEDQLSYQNRWKVAGRSPSRFISSVVYSEGKFYCQTYDHRLTMFTVAEHDWKLKYAPLFFRGNLEVSLAKSEEGDILKIELIRLRDSEDPLIKVDCQELTHYTYISRLDPECSTWETVDGGFTGKLLFIGSCNVSISANAVRNRRFGENKTYAFWGNMNKQHFKICSKYRCPPYSRNNDFHPEEGHRMIWIEPPY
ncbi:hypothetical protein AQUCO_00300776v1 [Aquilegia coerulea]|uniref:Uncharacterized protein n=1 Tax=Aquilegia coerulea TaxID=218851 RepID=A0A2G5F0F2_AQUCA|nr:hypothetical protein AQUCO_00300776v1 [Aquilegia coerulea]